MIMGFLKDSRVEEERQRTEMERQRAADAEARAERDRERAERAAERADRILERYEAATAALIQRLEEQNGAGKNQAGGTDSA